MSTDIQTKMKGHTAVEFWGGEKRGVCMQITAAHLNIKDTVMEQLQVEGFIQLTVGDAMTLVETLKEFIARRKGGG